MEFDRREWVARGVPGRVSTDADRDALVSAVDRVEIYGPLAMLLLERAGGKAPLVYLQYDFTEVYVDNIQWSGSSGGDDTPAESVSFSFATVKVQYWPQKKDGTAGTLKDASWNVTTNNESVS